MGLDDLDDALARFIPALEGFTADLRRVEAERAEVESSLQGIWDDSFQREFQTKLADLCGPLESFLEHDAPQFEGFLSDKLLTLRRYRGN